MELEIVSKEQALALKKIDFNWKTPLFYSSKEKEREVYTGHNNHWNMHRSYYAAPTVALALKWARYKKVICEISWSATKLHEFTLYTRDLVFIAQGSKFTSWEKAESGALDQVIKHLSNEYTESKRDARKSSSRKQSET